MSKNLNETVRLHSEKREEWLREARDHRGLQRAGATLPISPAHQVRRSRGEMSVQGPIVA